MRVGHDVLAASARLAGGWRVDGAARGAPRRAWPRGRYRLGTSERGQCIGPRKRGGQETGPNPTDRGKFGSKHHIVVDAKGIPLAIRVTAANVHDSRMFEAMVDAIPAIAGPRGHLRRRPAKVHADKGYDYDRCRAALRKRGIAQRIARRGIEPKERLGRHRWVVERTIAWLHGFRRLTLRTARRVDIHSAFVTLAAALVCHRFVDRLC